MMMMMMTSIRHHRQSARDCKEAELGDLGTWGHFSVEKVVEDLPNTLMYMYIKYAISC